MGRLIPMDTPIIEENSNINMTLKRTRTENQAGLHKYSLRLEYLCILHPILNFSSGVGY